MTPLLITAAVLCTNLNYQHSEPCMAPVATMEVRDWGFDGYLESGIYWKQIKVHEDLHYFQMQDVRYWITSRGIVYVQ